MMLNNISVFHSSIKICGEKIVYFDPYKIVGEPHDADLIFVTHSHFDHYSPDDIEKIINDNTIIIAPKSCEKDIEFQNVIYVTPDYSSEVQGINFETIRAYNINKNFHPKQNDWLGYVVTIDGTTYYVVGDSDITPEAEAVKCDVALIPCGGTYTMNVNEAVKLANTIKPKYAIPTHYGSVAGSPKDGELFVSLIDKDIQGVVKILN